MTKPMLKSLAVVVLFLPAVAQADSLYLYTIDFGATQVTAATSVSYLSEGLLSGTSYQFLPVQTTLISLPNPFATQTPGTGAGSVSSSQFGLDFILNNKNLLFLGDTSSPVNGPGTYDFSYSNLSYTNGQNYTPVGEVVVTQVTAPSLYFRYTESWNATAYSARTTYYYDSPVFLAEPDEMGFGADPTAAVSEPAPGATPADGSSLFTFSQQAEAGYFTDNSGNSWYFNGQTASPITTVGTFGLTGNLNYNGTTINETGTIKINYATEASASPEPGSVWLCLAGVLGAGFYFRKSVRA